MDERTEFLRSPADISGHPALKAWSQLQAEPVETGEISVLKQRLKSTIYRIKILEPRPFSIVAKYCQRRVAAHERFIYEQILPKVPVSSPYYHGFVKGTPPCVRKTHRGGSPTSGARLCVLPRASPWRARKVAAKSGAPQPAARGSRGYPGRDFAM